MVYFPPPSPDSDWDSDKEEDGIADQRPLDIDWFAVQGQVVGICSLPGNRLGGARRSLPADLKTLQRCGIQDVFVLCRDAELNRCRVPILLHEYEQHEIVVHHFPIEENNIPNLVQCIQLLSEFHKTITRKKTVVHCYDGNGRTCLLLAMYAMIMDEYLTAGNAIELVRGVRGPGAIQTVKQYNFIMGFHRHIGEIRPRVFQS